MDRTGVDESEQCYFKLYGLYDAKSIIIFRYNISWMVDGCIFEMDRITEQFIWDKGVNQLVTIISFDSFCTHPLIQIVLITAFWSCILYLKVRYGKEE